MTREQAKELLLLLKAYAEGKTLQVDYARNPEGWKDYDGKEACFDNENWIWRVKPEPRQFWLVRPIALPAKLPVGVWDTVPDHLPASDYEIIHVREVVD